MEQFILQTRNEVDWGRESVVRLQQLPFPFLLKIGCPGKLSIGPLWEQHGIEVANTRIHIPSSWDKFLRNIDIKYSDYKAKEWETYFYGLGPGLLEGYIPEPYFSHYLKIVYCVRILRKRQISQTELNHVENLIIEFVEEFEKLYYQRDIHRINFCRISLHKFLYLVAQTRRVGPFIYVTQWTLERTIGILGSRLRQPSRPYQNLSRQCIQQAQCQALRSIDPTLMKKRALRTLPRGALDLRNSYALLRASVYEMGACNFLTAREFAHNGKSSSGLSMKYASVGILCIYNELYPGLEQWGPRELKCNMVSFTGFERTSPGTDSTVRRLRAARHPLCYSELQAGC
ncbi:hypothetical protein BT69DRAFT_1297314 [Atractiella rhizophila]|nr:hypothetical protein BT69DRAFT_1297314 [Atractiella rhizophila]